ncbi:SOS response-associated peptidase [Urechidicola sp. KH5]
MCYQTRLQKKKEEIKSRFQADLDDLMSIEDFQLNKAFEFPKTPIITNQNEEKIELAQWGLIPEWAQDDSIKNYTLNARIETLSEKPSFKNVIQNRCLIIADGFYEWQHLSKSNKQKFEITLSQEKLFAFAGLFSEWFDFDGQLKRTYTIITTQANDLMSEIHNTKQRMPVILKPQDEKYWLQGEDYKKYAFPYQEELIAHPIDKDQNTSQLSLF